ncbi:hypothetical protein LXA43DRAFT_1097230 [Ganoderma leucocontextum]|nr:hypothetical protein LXA43DRAFT_1097230 [Ganoderma leucocontextum]
MGSLGDGDGEHNNDSARAVKDYVSRGATISKINTPSTVVRSRRPPAPANPTTASVPAVEAGVYSYKFLPLSGATVIENTTDVTSYSYDSSKQELVAYDTPDIAKLKA